MIFANRNATKGILPLHRTFALERFEEHHRAIRALLIDAETTVRQAEPERARKLALIRWQLARTLRSYQLFKHLEIFNPMISAGAPGTRQLATAMNDRCCAIGRVFEDHVRRWSSGNIESDWRTYEEECAGLIGHLRQHLDRERAEADQLLAGITDVPGGPVRGASASYRKSR